MPLLFIYLLKLSISLALVYLFYQLLLRRLTFYNSNRWYLAGYSFLCFFFSMINIGPLLKVQHWDDMQIIQWVPIIETNDPRHVQLSHTASSFDYWKLAGILIVTGALIMLIRMLIQLLS